MFEACIPLGTLPSSDRLVTNGNPLTEKDVFGEDWKKGLDARREIYFRVYDSRGEFMGIYEWEQDKARLKPWKMFLGG